METERPRRALVTNDDGIDSHGLRPLVAAAAGAGLDVLVAAPSWDSSGASASLTAVEQDGRFLVHDVDPGDPLGARWIGVEGAPAFIVRAAVTGAFGDPPDVVLSGVNQGLNTGHAVLHSGTVGAVLTGQTAGRRGMAVSIDAGRAPRWDTAGEVASALLPWLLERDPGTVVNVNVPDVDRADLRGVRPARLARFGAVQTAVTERGRGWVRLGYTQVDAASEPGTDAAAVAEGYASVTVLRGVTEAAPGGGPLPGDGQGATGS